MTIPLHELDPDKLTSEDIDRAVREAHGRIRASLRPVIARLRISGDTAGSPDLAVSAKSSRH